MIEGAADPDGGGQANFLDGKSDDDGIPDSVEHAFGTNPYDTDNPARLPLAWRPVALALLLAGCFGTRSLILVRRTR